jgi:hypothetical protein
MLEDLRMDSASKTYTYDEIQRIANANIPDTGRSWWQWKADRLNELFLSRGKGFVPGSIAPATVRHGELCAKLKTAK